MVIEYEAMSVHVTFESCRRRMRVSGDCRPEIVGGWTRPRFDPKRMSKLALAVLFEGLLLSYEYSESVFGAP
jgi:hypothetical protein